MNIEHFRDTLAKDGPSRVFGIEYHSTPDEDICVATMAVSEANTQPFGFLSGGAMLALGETLAGVGSSALCPGKICVGINVHANHVHTATAGDTVTATARILHRGSTTHVWSVEIKNDHDQLISSISVTNYIVNK